MKAGSPPPEQKISERILKAKGKRGRVTSPLECASFAFNAILLAQRPASDWAGSKTYQAHGSRNGRPGGAPGDNPRVKVVGEGGVVWEHRWDLPRVRVQDGQGGADGVTHVRVLEARLRKWVQWVQLQTAMME